MWKSLYFFMLNCPPKHAAVGSARSKSPCHVKPCSPRAMRNPVHGGDAVHQTCQSALVRAVCISLRSHDGEGGKGELALKLRVSGSTCWVRSHRPLLQPWKAVHSQSTAAMRSDACPSPGDRWTLELGSGSNTSRQQQHYLRHSFRKPTRRG